MLCAACGDALLPADYQGPPAAEVGGSVVRQGNISYTEAGTPRFSVEWLNATEAESSGTPLLSQTVSFTRSQHLQKDWDLGIDLPKGAAQIRINFGTNSAKVAIGKLVYFDDKDGDRQLDWNCTRPQCDQVKALSAEFVVFLDQPLTCAGKTPGANKKTRFAGGFHYFRLEGTSVQEISADLDLQFELSDTPAAWANPTAQLQRFALQFQRAYSLGELSGCS